MASCSGEVEDIFHDFSICQMEMKSVKLRLKDVESDRIRFFSFWPKMAMADLSSQVILTLTGLQALVPPKWRESWWVIFPKLSCSWPSKEHLLKSPGPRWHLSNGKSIITWPLKLQGLGVVTVGNWLLLLFATVRHPGDFRPKFPGDWDRNCYG